jgi:hypothetical protein
VPVQGSGKAAQVTLAGLPLIGVGVLVYVVSEWMGGDGRGVAVLRGIGIYCACVGLLHAAAVGYAMCFSAVRGRVALSGYRWIATWHLMVAGIVAMGGLVGALLFPLIGSFARMDYTVVAMLRRGLLDGAFYALIWAPGISFVWCAVRARRQVADS